MDGMGKLSPVGSGQSLTSVKQAAGENGTGFGEILKGSIDAVNNRMTEAEGLANGLVSGEHSNIHETMIAMEKANISFRLLAKIHTKAINAYQEIMRMQV